MGTATAARPGYGWGQGLIWWRLAMALLVALALQVGVNFANDYSDGVRGVDDERRVGPRRLVGSGLAAPAAVRNAAVGAGLVAGGAGLALAAAAGWELLAVGAACLAAGWFYSGGRRPYGYRGWGEVGVFVFFGLVAAVGSAYVQLEALTLRSLWAGLGCGCLSCALLVANNLRDLSGDATAGKRTLAVRIGPRRTRLLYAALVAGGFAALVLRCGTAAAGAGRRRGGRPHRCPGRHRTAAGGVRALHGHRPLAGSRPGVVRDSLYRLPTPC